MVRRGSSRNAGKAESEEGLKGFGKAAGRGKSKSSPAWTRNIPVEQRHVVAAKCRNSFVKSLNKKPRFRPPRRPAPRKVSFNDSDFDLVAALDQWIEATSKGDTQRAKCIVKKFNELGVDPYRIWPDHPWDEYEQSSESGHENMSSESGHENIQNDNGFDDERVDIDIEPIPCRAIDIASAVEPTTATQTSHESDPILADVLDRPSAGEFATAMQVSEDYYRLQIQISREPSDSHGILFSRDLLDNAPSSIQTCNGLSAFLTKKLSAPSPVAPAMRSPSKLQATAQAKLHAYVDSACRLASLQQIEGWDARGKRVLNIPAWLRSDVGQSMWKLAHARLQEELAELTSMLGMQEDEQVVKALVHERQPWVGLCLQQEWLTWCARLLDARKADLRAGGKTCCTVSTIESGLCKRAVEMWDIFNNLLGAGCVSNARPSSQGEVASSS